MSEKTGPGSLLDQLAAQHLRHALIDQLAEEAGQRRVASEAAAMTTDEVFRVRMHHLIQRLPQITALQPPPAYLVTEIILLLEAAEHAYPEEVASVLAQRMKVRAKERLGRCVHDACEDPAAPGLAALGFCAAHFEQAQAEAELT